MLCTLTQVMGGVSEEQAAEAAAQSEEVGHDHLDEDADKEAIVEGEGVDYTVDAMKGDDTQEVR